MVILGKFENLRPGERLAQQYNLLGNNHSYTSTILVFMPVFPTGFQLEFNEILLHLKKYIFEKSLIYFDKLQIIHYIKN